MTFAEYIQGLMDERGVKAADVCRATGISKQILSQILNGQTKDPRLSTLGPLCEYFRITIADIAEALGHDHA